MDLIYNIFFYLFVFISLYLQIFFLVTYFQKRKHVVYSLDNMELKTYPTVTIMVPCYNEEKTLEKTIKSLLPLDYPKEQLKLV